MNRSFTSSRRGWTRAALAPIVAALLAAAAPPAAADPDCPLRRVSGSDRTVDPSAIRQGLYQAAVAAEVNRVRCQAGLPALKSNPRVGSAAAGHARYMAAARSVTHRQPEASRRSPVKRVATAGLGTRPVAENIGRVPLYRLDGIGRFRIEDAAACRFATSDGTPVPRHSYASLARHSVALWNASAGHRRNLLEQNARMLGAGAGFDPKAPHCGDVYVVLTLVR